MIRPTLKQVSIVVVGVTLLSTLSCVNSSDPVEMAEPKLVWSAEIPLGYSNLVMPLIDRGRAYVGSDTSLSCFDITTGNRLWRKSLQGSGSIGGTKVLGSDDAIFINNSNTVWAFHRETGNVIWKTSTADFRSLDLEALFQTSTHLFLGGHGEVMRIAKSTGNVDLRIPVTQLIPGGLKQSASDPVVSESEKRLYVPTGYFPGDTLKGNLLCFDSETGQYLWGYSPPSFTVFDIQSCVLSDSLVIFPSGYSMICLNRFTGATLWISTVSQDAFWSSPTISGECMLSTFAPEPKNGDRGALKVQSSPLLRFSMGKSFFATCTSSGFWMRPQEMSFGKEIPLNALTIPEQCIPLL
jgi:outer membrane protein assembly factor BamB